MFLFDCVIYFVELVFLPDSLSHLAAVHQAEEAVLFYMPQQDGGAGALASLSQGRRSSCCGGHKTCSQTWPGRRFRLFQQIQLQSSKHSLGKP